MQLWQIQTALGCFISLLYHILLFCFTPIRGLSSDRLLLLLWVHITIVFKLDFFIMGLPMKMNGATLFIIIIIYGSATNKDTYYYCVKISSIIIFMVTHYYCVRIFIIIIIMMGLPLKINEAKLHSFSMEGTNYYWVQISLLIMGLPLKINGAKRYKFSMKGTYYY